MTQTPNPGSFPEPNRREFLQAAGTAALGTAMAAGSGTTHVSASDKSGSKSVIVGTGDYQYECHHGWGQLPPHIRWGETHGVAVDEAGLVYIKHRSHAPEPMDAVAVFEPSGRFVRSFGKKYHGGGHGIDIRKEGREEFLYLCDTKHGFVDKTTLKGDVVWSKGRPAEPGIYDDPAALWKPTNLAFAPDGGFYVADGYGSHYIHQYDRDVKWVRSWGGFGDGKGQFKTPHGLWVDDRPGRQPSLVVADRANARLQYFTLDGWHLSFQSDVSFPAHFDIRGEVLLVPDLHSRITLFDKANQVITHLGYDADWTRQVLDGFKIREQPERWQNGRFVHPHDACFDRDGNIYVAEWVPTGRISFLKRMA